MQERIISQNLVEDDREPIRVQNLLESALSEELLKEFIGSAPPPAPTKVGLSPAYSSSGHLTALAIATPTEVLIVQFHTKSKSENAKTGRKILEDNILCNTDCTLYAFDLAVLACSLFYDHGLHIVNGINIQNVVQPNRICPPLVVIQFAVGDHVEVHKENVIASFQEMSWDPSRTTPLALRAWISNYLPVALPDMEERFHRVKRVNTKDLNETYLEYIAQLARGDQRLALKKAPTTAHEFGWQTVSKQKATVNSTRFQSRIQKSANMEISVRDAWGAEYRVHGRTDDITGRAATLKAGASLEGKVITAITSLGSDRATNAEMLNAATLLRALQGEIDLLDNPFLKYILFPMEDDASFTWPESFVSSELIPPITSSHLNSSQHHGVKSMLSMTDSTRITMIKGPPGTGKTTVIAAYVSSAIAAGFTGIWIVAQTNVAVKNIAEKLVDAGFIDWKLLVSADFHIDWHEHLYYKVNKNIIRSDEFQKAGGLLQGCPVVLCTLSMLSNERVKNFSQIVPLSTLVVDEASQIAVNSYVGPLSTYLSLRKICFIGDDKQLPPYGQDDNDDLKSVFEVPHLCHSVILLDIQYRMPPHIGDVISREVYDSKLFSNSNHPIKKPISCFVHVEEGCEKRDGTSWKNFAEAKAVINIAAKLQYEGKKYRIITPYDSQRNLLENEMRSSGLKWQDKVFNVDSFQGNEDDHIVISLVRSKQELGFLTDIRRTNVMLTRCKQAMYICSHWDFVWGTAKDTLVGKMAEDWKEEAWKDPEEFNDFEK